jgi:hypothetical protein
MTLSEAELGEIYDQGKDACVAIIKKFFDAQQQRIDELEERVRELENVLGSNSSNSSIPPSQDPFRARARPRVGKRGHAHHAGGRKLVPVSEVDEVVDLYPQRCVVCSLPLASTSPHVGASVRHQQVEIPEPKAIVTEYRLHTCRCRGCGQATRAQLPPEAAPVFGPRLQAQTALLMADKRQSTRQLQQLLFDLHGVDIAIGTISKIAVAAGEVVEPTAESIHAHMLEESALYIDETSWRVANQPAWMWGVFTPKSAYYKIACSRAQALARELVPPLYDGIVHTDCYGGYSYLDHSQRQICFAHLLRHFRAHAERERAGPAHTFGERGMCLSERACALSKSSTSRQRQRLRKDMHKLIAFGLSHDETKTMARTLNKHEASLWHCLERVDVDATNNHAERMLRPAVIKRKLSFGSGSSRGANALAALLSVTTTARLRGHSPYAFIEASIRASLVGQQLPLLA